MSLSRQEGPPKFGRLEILTGEIDKMLEAAAWICTPTTWSELSPEEQIQTLEICGVTTYQELVDKISARAIKVGYWARGGAESE